MDSGDVSILLPAMNETFSLEETVRIILTVSGEQELNQAAWINGLARFGHAL